MKFRKKPVEIEAVQWKGNNWTEVYFFCKDPKIMGWSDNTLSIETLEGKMTASLGDWIIRGIKGEFYPCKPDIFEETYEEVK